MNNSQNEIPNSTNMFLKLLDNDIDNQQSAQQAITDQSSLTTSELLHHKNKDAIKEGINKAIHNTETCEQDLPCLINLAKSSLPIIQEHTAKLYCHQMHQHCSEMPDDNIQSIIEVITTKILNWRKKENATLIIDGFIHNLMFKTCKLKEAFNMLVNHLKEACGPNSTRKQFADNTLQLTIFFIENAGTQISINKQLNTLNELSNLKNFKFKPSQIKLIKSVQETCFQVSNNKSNIEVLIDAFNDPTLPTQLKKQFSENSSNNLKPKLKSTNPPGIQNENDTDNDEENMKNSKLQNEKENPIEKPKRIKKNSVSVENNEPQPLQNDEESDDLWTIKPPVNISSKFPHTWTESVKDTVKWTEKKVKIESLINFITQSVNVECKDIFDICALVKQLINDTIAVINLCALKLLSTLCTAGRRSMRQYLKAEFIQLLISKLKDKKLVSECLNTLSVCYQYSLGGEDIIDEVDKALYDSRTTNVQKIALCKLMSNISSVDQVGDGGKSNLKLDMANAFCSTHLKEQLNDPDPKLKDEASNTLAVQCRKQGLDHFDNVLNLVHPSRLDQIKAAVNNNTEVCSTNQITKKMPLKQDFNSTKTTFQNTKCLNNYGSTNNLNIGGKNNHETALVRKVNKDRTASVDRVNLPKVQVEIELDLEAAKELFSLILSDNMIEWDDSTPQTKAESILLLCNVEFSSLPGSDINLFLQNLKKLTNNFNEKNLNCLKSILKFINQISSCELLDKTTFELCNQVLFDNFNDVKHKSGIKEALYNFMQRLGNDLIMKNALAQLNQSKNPKFIASMVDIVTYGLESFLYYLIDVEFYTREISALSSQPSPLLKTACQTFFIQLQKIIGIRVKKFLGHMEEKFMKNLEIEFEKITESIENDNVEFKGAALTQQAKHGKNLEDLFPKVNVQAQLSHDDLHALSEANWNAKKLILDRVNNLITASNYAIANEGAKELVELILRNLTTENNKQTKKQFIQTLGIVGQALSADKGRKLHSKVSTALMKLLADKFTRSEAQQAIVQWNTNCGMDLAYSCFAHLLSTTIVNPEVSLEVLSIFNSESANVMKTNPSIKKDADEIITHNMEWLVDRKQELRDQAFAFLKSQVSAFGDTKVSRLIVDKPRSIQSILQGILANASKAVVEGETGNTVEPHKIKNDGFHSARNENQNSQINRIGNNMMNKNPNINPANNPANNTANNPANNPAINNVTNQPNTTTVSPVLVNTQRNSHNTPRKDTSPSSVIKRNSHSKSRDKSKDPKDQKKKIGPTCSTTDRQYENSQNNGSMWLSAANKDRRLKRAQKQKLNPWKIDKFSPLQAEYVTKEIGVIMEMSNVDLFFDKDFKKIESLFELIISDLDKNPDLSLVNSDIIVSMLFIKLMDMAKLKTSTFKTIIDVVWALLRLQEYEACLLEFEVYSILLPIIIERLGYPNIIFKNKLADALLFCYNRKLIECKLLVKQLLEGLSTKNNKTIQEIISVIIELIKLNREAVPTKDIKEIAKFVDSKDNNVKNISLSYLVQEYQNHKDNLIDYLKQSVTESGLEIIKLRLNPVEKKAIELPSNIAQSNNESFKNNLPQTKIKLAKSESCTHVTDNLDLREYEAKLLKDRSPLQFGGFSSRNNDQEDAHSPNQLMMQNALTDTQRKRSTSAIGRGIKRIPRAKYDPNEPTMTPIHEQSKYVVENQYNPRQRSQTQNDMTARNNNDNDQPRVSPGLFIENTQQKDLSQAQDQEQQTANLFNNPLKVTYNQAKDSNKNENQFVPNRIQEASSTNSNSTNSQSLNNQESNSTDSTKPKSENRFSTDNEIIDRFSDQVISPNDMLRSSRLKKKSLKAESFKQQDNIKEMYSSIQELEEKHIKLVSPSEQLRRNTSIRTESHSQKFNSVEDLKGESDDLHVSRVSEQILSPKDSKQSDNELNERIQEDNEVECGIELLDEKEINHESANQQNYNIKIDNQNVTPIQHVHNKKSSERKLEFKLNNTQDSPDEGEPVLLHDIMNLDKKYNSSNKSSEQKDLSDAKLSQEDQITYRSIQRKSANRSKAREYEIEMECLKSDTISNNREKEKEFSTKFNTSQIRIEKMKKELREMKSIQDNSDERIKSDSSTLKKDDNDNIDDIKIPKKKSSNQVEISCEEENKLYNSKKDVLNENKPTDQLKNITNKNNEMELKKNDKSSNRANDIKEPKHEKVEPNIKEIKTNQKPNASNYESVKDQKTNQSSHNVQFPSSFSKDDLLIQETYSMQEQLEVLIEQVKQSRMTNFKVTLMGITDLKQSLLQAAQTPEWVAECPTGFPDQLAQLTRELLHQLLLEGTDFISDQMDYSMRLCEFIETVCSIKPLTRKMSDSNLFLLTQDLLSSLLNSTLDSLIARDYQSTVKSGEELKKVLNGSAIKLFESARSHKVIATLLDILTATCSILVAKEQVGFKNTFNPDELSARENMDPHPSMVNLACRCLFKMLKLLKDIVRGLDVPDLLNRIWPFLQAHRKDQGGKPQCVYNTFKAFKTVIYELATVEGTRLWTSYNSERFEGRKEDTVVKECIEKILAQEHEKENTQDQLANAQETALAKIEPLVADYFQAAEPSAKTDLLQALKSVEVQQKQVFAHALEALNHKYSFQAMIDLKMQLAGCKEWDKEGGSAQCPLSQMRALNQRVRKLTENKEKDADKSEEKVIQHKFKTYWKEDDKETEDTDNSIKRKLELLINKLKNK